MLNSRAIAIQGFAYSPITIAVQGFIAQLQEEQQQRYGGGGRAKGGYAKSFGLYSVPKPARSRKTSEADLIRLVNEKYDAIEKAREREAQREEKKTKVEAKREAKAEAKKIEAVALDPLESPFEAQAEAKRQAAIEDEQIMLAMCQLMLED